MAAKVTKAQQAEAIEQLRGMLEPGDTIYTVLRHTSRSGMYRAIDLYLLHDDDRTWLSRLAATATGIRFDERYEAMGTSGCGMDMGFSLVYDLAAALYPEGFDCIGEGCPANDHNNAYLREKAGTCIVCGGNRPVPSPYIRGRHLVCSQACVSGQWVHKSGGYALRHKWL